MLALCLSVSCWGWVFTLFSGRTHVILGLLLELGIRPLLSRSLVRAGLSPSSLVGLTLSWLFPCPSPVGDGYGRLPFSDWTF
jgi:hypothetical protein